MTCNFLTLSDDLFLLIAMEMKMEDVLRLRQTCWRLHGITKIKALWLKISRPSWIDYLNGGFSCYSTDVHDMTSGQIEAIHKICLRAESRSRSIGPQTLYKWNIPQSVDWLKIVASRWVFVAASDHSVSRLLCWDMLSVSSGSSAPLAECFLPARVNSGMIEVQSEGLLVCLGLGPTPISEVQILTLRRMGTSFLFVETFTIPDCSDVQLFQGNLFVCGVFQGLQAPVLVDWRTSTVYHLFGEVPDLCVKSFPVGIWLNFLVVIWNLKVVLWSLEDPPFAPIFLEELPLDIDGVIRDVVLRTPFPCDNILEEAEITMIIRYEYPEDTGNSPLLTCCLHRHSRKDVSDPLVFSMEYEDEACIACSHMQLLNDKDPCSNRLLVSDFDFMICSFGLSSTYQSGRSTCLRGLNPMFPCPDLYLDLPCSWAFMQFDFDIRTGLMACADAFGRIAIVDYYSRDSRCVWALPRPEVGFEKEIELGQVVASTVPIPLAHASSLDLIMSESLKMPLSIRCDAVVTSNMGDWSVDWSSWPALHLWQWFPGSISWILRYYYGILVECVPIAYRASEVLFRASGFQYLFHLSFFPDAQDMVDWYPYNNVFHLRLCPADVVDDLSSFPDLSTLWEMDRSHKYVHARYIYETIYTLEVKSGRDRWLEQRGRGGVHPPGLPTLWDFHRFKFMPHLKTVTWSPVDIIDEVPSKPQTNVAVTSEWITPDRQCMCPPFPFIRQDPCPPKSQ